jgi:ParB-like chromosome segregation protein Spo0J
MSRTPNITPYERRAILALLDLGLTDADVAQRIGRTRAGIGQMRKRCGVPDAKTRRAQATAAPATDTTT